MTMQMIDASDKRPLVLEIAQEQSLKDTALFIFQSDHDPDQPSDDQILKKMTDKKLQDRSLKEYTASHKHAPLLSNNYRWEMIGKESSNDFKRALHGQGCIKWHQLPVNAEESKENDFFDDSTDEKRLPITLASIRNAQEKMRTTAGRLRMAYKKITTEQNKLFYQETLGVVTPIAALTSLKAAQKNCRAHLASTEKTETTISNTISKLRKVIPLDLLQLLSANPEIKTNLFSLLQVQAQSESMNQEKEKTMARLNELLQREKEEIALLQNGIINFDRSALGDEELRQKARLQKIRNEIDKNPELNATSIQLTDEEYATYVFNYRRALVLGNINGEQELETIQSACPKILQPMASRTIVASFDEKNTAKPCAQKDSSDTEEDEEIFESDADQGKASSSSSSTLSSSSTTSSSSGYFGNWW